MAPIASGNGGMNMENNSSVHGGTDVAGLLAVAFIVLKLCGIIEWSWWWVLAPIWISVAIILIAILIWRIIEWKI